MKKTESAGSVARQYEKGIVSRLVDRAVTSGPARKAVLYIAPAVAFSMLVNIGSLHTKAGEKDSRRREKHVAKRREQQGEHKDKYAGKAKGAGDKNNGKS